MIIIKNIILYVIQIRHTDDFLSTGTQLVISNLLHTCTYTLHSPSSRYPGYAFLTVATCIINIIKSHR